MNTIVEQVQSGDFDPKTMFTGNKEKFLEVKTAIESISSNLPKELCIKFILTKIIPTVFDKSIDNTIRDEAVEIGSHFLQFVNITVLSTKEQENVFTSIEETYTKVIGELRDSGYANWDKLWIFLIKLCGEKLHIKMSLTNKLLRVVEVAFRNSTSIEQRLKAYDCWIELINTSSLNMEHMCSAKQIKLLVTPMKAKFSRMPVVIMKRCDTFVYLLEKLEDKATLCLKEFLEFCFGPFDDKNNVERMRQGRSVSEVCIKSTKVLLEVIGHSHDGSEVCLNSDDLHLYKPLISDVNFLNFAEILIKSVIECCILLNEWSQDLPKNNTIVKCLWRSLLQLVHNSSDEVDKKCCIQISGSLKRLLERSHQNENFLTVLGNITDVLIQSEFVEKFRDVIFDISLHIFQHVGCFSFDVENIHKFTISCFDAENGSKFDRIASASFKSLKKCENPILCDIWLKCKITIVPDNIANFIWPIRHLQTFKDIEALKSKWSKLYTTECKLEMMKAIVIQEIEKLFLDNPLLSSNVVEFLTLIASVETTPSKDFVAKFMRLIELVLTLPNLSDADVKKLSSIVLSHCNQSQHFYKSESNDEALDKVCGCLEHLVTIHKDYKILTELTTQLKSGHPKNLTKFAKRLMSFLEALMLNEDNIIANNTRKLIELLETKENEPDTISLASSRSLRIVNMANISQSKRLSDHASNVKLFGKDKDKPSPLSLKSKTFSSPRGKNRIVDNKKKKEPNILNEDNSSDYVKIDTEVKLDIKKLSEHQKEMLKRRREDIPALYEDLTQSQSQSYSMSEDSTDRAPKKDEVEESAYSAKKRKRGDSDDFQHVTKARREDTKLEEPLENRETNNDDQECKIIESSTEIKDQLNSEEKNILEADTETLEIADSDLTHIFGDEDVETIPKIRTEDLNNMNIFEDETPAFIQKVRETKKAENTKVEDNIVTTNDEVQSNDQEVMQSDIEYDKIVPNSEEVDAVEKNDSNVIEGKVSILNTSEKKTSPVRKSKRHSSRRFHDDIINVVKKQLEESVEKETDETPNTTLDISQSKAEDNTLDDTNIHDSEDQVDTEESKLGERQETSVRKSKRQVKKRQSDYMITLQRRKRYSSKENEDVIIITKPDTVKEKHERKENKFLDNSLRKKQKLKGQQNQEETNNKVDENEETIESLLARVDKRIEDKKKAEKKQNIEVSGKAKAKDDTEWNEADLQDGNQNKISLSTKKLGEIQSSKEKDFEVKNRPSTPVKGKRKLTLSPQVAEELKEVDLKNRPSTPVKGKRRFTLSPLITEELNQTSSPIHEVVKNDQSSVVEGAEDVYEFKGDDDTLPSEEVKKPKRKKKSMVFNRSDYTIKRRRRTKKDTKEEGFPFHVTADSPIPLSKSSSLRAVTSPQEGETITILITRSPPDSTKESKEIPVDSGNTSPNSPKKRSRRKTSPNSEDVIESSQASPPLETSRRRSSKGRSRLRQTLLDEIIELDPSKDNIRITRSLSSQIDSEVNISESTTTYTEVANDDTTVNKGEEVTCPPKPLSIRRLSLTEPSSQKIQVGTRLKRSQSLDKLDFDTETITFSLPQNKHVNDTSADTLTCETASTDAKQEPIAIDLSPETVITDSSEEVVKTEAEKIQQADTLTLSPVKSDTKDDLPASPITYDTPDRTVELLNNTSDISPISSASEMSTPVHKHVGSEVSNMRVARLLQMANSKVQISDEGRRWFGNKHSSPSSSRVRKMRLKKEESLDILTFSREVPSPLTVPASGILKRKLSSLEETATPSPKRKRVNFSDPAITEKKIFIKDTDEYDDIDQNTESTNESHDDQDDFNEKAGDTKPKGPLDALRREDLLFNFKDFCDSNFKDVHNSKIKDALKQLLQNLKVPEVVDVISEYLNNMDSETIDEIKSATSGTSQHVIDNLVVPLIENVVSFEEFLPKLLEVVEKLPDEKLENFANEVTKVFGERIRDGSSEEVTEKQVEDRVFNLGCDKMSDLIKKYCFNLEGEERNGFLVRLMNLASSELPVNKEFVNCHVNVLQDFVKRMTD